VLINHIERILDFEKNQIFVNEHRPSSGRSNHSKKGHSGSSDLN